MFDLKFPSSALDKMPAGTSFRDSDHVITKTHEGWKCDDCYVSTLCDSSSAYTSDTSQEYALVKFAGSEIDPDNLDPRLTAFLPAGTRVVDCDTQLNDEWHWHKTRVGLWVWDESREEAEDAANRGIGHEDLTDLDHLRPFRLHSVGTDEAPESDGTPIDPARLTAAEATSLGAAVYDSVGGVRIHTSEGGYRLALGDDLLGKLREQLPEDYAPYSTEVPEVESAPEPEPETEPKRIPESESDLTAAEATNFKDCRFRDRHDDVWLFDEETERWRFIRSDGALSCLFRYERLDAFLEPYVLVEGETEVETEPETEVDPAEELSAEQADEKRDFVLSDTDCDKWTYSDGNWHCEGHEHLSCSHLPDMFEPYEIVEPLEAPEPEPAEGAKLSAKEASEHKDTVFEDSDGDAWFFDDVLQRWRGIGPDWAYSKEELEPLFSPYTKVGPLSEHERGWTAEEANRLKDEALEDRDGDLWIYDAPSEQWKCNNPDATASADLDEAFQPYRIKKAAQGRPAVPEAVILGFDEPFKLSGDTEEPSPEAEASEEVTFEGSAREAVELLDRIARSLESISNKLGDK